MGYTLDTNACIDLLRGRSPTLAARLRTENPDDIVVCSVVRYELWAGVAGAADPEVERQKVEGFLAPFRTLPFDDDAALVCGNVRRDLERRGARIGAYDLQIAAIALVHDLTLVTGNLAEFRRVAGLRSESWAT